MKSVLQARPEACVAVLCHWGVINALCADGADIPTIAPSWSAASGASSCASSGDLTERARPSAPADEDPTEHTVRIRLALMPADRAPPCRVSLPAMRRRKGNHVHERMNEACARSPIIAADHVAGRVG